VQGSILTAAQTHSGLLERDRELARLGDWLSAVSEERRGRLAFIGGEAGVGKTALIKEFCDEHRESARVVMGTCDPLFTPRPLGPLLDVADTVGGEIAQLMNADPQPHVVASALLHELRSNRATILVFEDVHWADEATLDVIRLVGRRIDSAPALLIASYRDDELEAAKPLRLLLGHLADADRVILLPLSPDAVATLSEQRLDADELFRVTAGNPFFVTEVLAAGTGEIPHTVRDAVLARASRLSPPARTVLETVAVVPPHAELWLLDALAGEAADHVDECLGSGMLRSQGQAVVFRHELARLAVEESLPLTRSRDLHTRALAALAEAPDGAPDLARLAHHADALGDSEAVLRFAPAAAERAASLGAHREAVSHYARALRFGDRLSAAERAELLERRARECFLTDQYDEGIASLEEALECRRELGDRIKEGDALRRLSEFLWCPGRTGESERSARDAVALLEQLPPGRELAWAYANLAGNRACAARGGEAIPWGERALELAKRLGETEIAVNALSTLGACRDYNELEESLEQARLAGLDDEFGRIFIPLGAIAVESRRHDVATKHLEAGITYCSERGLELFRLYLLAYRARLELDQGRWSDAADTAASVLRIPRTSTTPRIVSLVVIGLLRARRGDPGQRAALDEAWTLAEPTGELPRLGPVAAARSEAAWLAGDHRAVKDASERALALAIELESAWMVGELAVWRRRAGIRDAIPTIAAEPFALQLDGQSIRAATLWRELGCPYEAALALAEADDDDALLRAHRELQALGAQPAAAIVARRLRRRGVRGLARGPRQTTRDNPANLTTRELEVLGLVAQGFRNADVAERLFLSEKTVDHHVSAILRNLEVRTRVEASTEAVRLGLVS
jgi:DNA-binding CsgD family transcriptional regulator/tetratricopeptide (TPR) repeat protein